MQLSLLKSIQNLKELVVKKYELYKGYELLAVGTVAEIASRLGVKKGTVRFYKSPVYQRRVKGENTRMLMEVDE